MAFMTRQGVLALVVLVLALAIRFVVVQRPELGWACQVADGAPWWCPLRSGLIATLDFGALGWISLAAGVCALAGGGRRVTSAAMLAGTAGLVLSAAGASAAGLILGTLRSLRLDRPACQDGEIG
ncbi:MAG: hypothetical protein KF815_06965 [Rhodospirillales bacterium]|nr:hypothetical protein [Rhodospirillales bacterium]